MGVGVQHEVFVAQGLDYIQHRLQVFVFDNGGHCRLARRIEVMGSNRQHCLAYIFHLVDGQQRVAGQQRADIFEAGNVFVGNDQAHAFKGVAGRSVNADDFGMSPV